MRHETLTLIDDRVFMGTGDGVAEIEDISRYCLGCHDGVVGPARQAPANSSASIDAGCSGLPGLHPIGVSFPAGKREYADPTTLPSTMYFSQGTLTCVTCHNLLSDNHDLVVSNERSALCLTCHRK